VSRARSDHACVGRHANVWPSAARRLFATTSKRVGRAFASSTVWGRRASRSSRGPCGDAGNNPCRRQGDQVVAPTSSGRWLVVEDDHGASGGRRNRATRLRGGRRRRPVVLSPGAHAGMGVPVGEGVRSATLRTIKRRSTPGAGLRPLAPAVAVVDTRPDGALACRPNRACRSRLRRGSQPGGSGSGSVRQAAGRGAAAWYWSATVSLFARVARPHRCVAARVFTTGKMSGDGSSWKFIANAIVTPWGRWRPTNER
jgi:hypothetical protein